MRTRKPDMRCPANDGMMRSLPLRALHENRGALFGERAGWEVPLSYSGLDEEVGATRSAAGLIDHSDRVTVRLTGADRVSFLNGLVTQDIAAMKPGECSYGLFLNPKGKVVGDAAVYALPDALLLDLPPDESGRVLEHIRKHLVSDDVAIEPFAAAHLALHGPMAPAFLRRVVGDMKPPANGEFSTVPIDRKRSIVIAGTDYLRLPGFRFISWTDSLEGVWRALTAFGPTPVVGATPVGREAWNTLRIEAGRPVPGLDMDENTIALEARMESAISYTKGCYEGQEVIARATYQGHMNRLLVGFRGEGDSIPARLSPVLLDGKQVGHVTSATYSPTLRYVIALGYIRKPGDAAGTRVEIVADGWQIRATVLQIPFVTGPRARTSLPRIGLPSLASLSG